MVVRSDTVSDRTRLSNCMEIRRQKGNSSSATETVILRLWSFRMRTSFPEFLPMTIRTRSANSCAAINPACAVCCGNCPGHTYLRPVALHQTLFGQLKRMFEILLVYVD